MGNEKGSLPQQSRGGADAATASEAETAKHPDVTEIRLCSLLFTSDTFSKKKKIKNLPKVL